METTNDSEHVGVSHLAGSLKEQRQNAIKVDVTADVLAERIKVRASLLVYVPAIQYFFRCSAR